MAPIFNNHCELSGSSPWNDTTSIIADTVFQQEDLDTMKLLGEKHAMLRQYLRKCLQFLVAQETGMPCRNQHSDMEFRPKTK